MKISLLKVLIISLTILTSCSEQVDNNTIVEEFKFSPILYDFDNLNLTLNSSISDSISSAFWTWNHMESDNSIPDSNGIEHYMNRNQPTFSYNGEETLPYLKIKVNKNRIIEFSATIIFRLNDEKVEDLLTKVTIFNLLKDQKIKQTIINKRIFKNVNSDFEETLELKLSDEEYGYNRITYEIKKLPLKYATMLQLIKKQLS